jgi:hypothetical protein
MIGESAIGSEAAMFLASDRLSGHFRRRGLQSSAWLALRMGGVLSELGTRDINVADASFFLRHFDGQHLNVPASSD